jgi:hypothetical protein
MLIEEALEDGCFRLCFLSIINKSSVNPDVRVTTCKTRDIKKEGGVCSRDDERTEEGAKQRSALTRCPSAQVPATLYAVPKASDIDNRCAGGIESPAAGCAQVSTEGNGRGTLTMHARYLETGVNKDRCIFLPTPVRFL